MNGETTNGPKRRGHGRWFLTLFVGIVLGAVLASVLPRDGGLGRLLSPPVVMEGEVVDKRPEPDRLVLKIATAQGLVLANFTSNRKDVDLLVEPGSYIKLEAERQQPFLDNPTIVSVTQPELQAPLSYPETREDYQRIMEEHLREWEAKLDELEAATARAKGELSEKYRPEIEKLHRMHDATRQKLATLEEASGNAWQDLRQGLDGAWREMDQALQKAATRFRHDETEAPEKPSE
jgi:hypothetical protein